jgi:hypothetical protein
MFKATNHQQNLYGAVTGKLQKYAYLKEELTTIWLTTAVYAV